jgi:hypothetical protein
VLIVDEICTTGETLRMALAAVRAVRPAEVRTATSFVKAGGYKPDFFAVETDAAVIFPWDRQVVTEAGELVENPSTGTCSEPSAGGGAAPPGSSAAPGIADVVLPGVGVVGVIERLGAGVQLVQLRLLQPLQCLVRPVLRRRDLRHAPAVRAVARAVEDHRPHAVVGSFLG